MTEKVEEYISESEEKPTEEDLVKFREEFSDSIILSDQFLVILGLTGARDSVQLEGYFDSQEELEEFAALVNNYGVNCYFDYSLEREESTVHSISSMISDEEAKSEMKKFTEASIICNIFMDRGDSSLEEVEEIVSLNDSMGSRYHRLFGQFLDYPERDIDSFIYKQKPEWKKKLLSLVGRDNPGMILAGKAADKYGSDLSFRDKRTLNCFIDHGIQDTEESFESTLETAKERRNILEEFMDVEELLQEVFYE